MSKNALWVGAGFGVATVVLAQLGVLGPWKIHSSAAILAEEVKARFVR